MKKEDVLAIIDEVMNNREIDSIRNAILAIRDKVIEANDEEKENDHFAVLRLRGNGNLCEASPWFEDAKYVVIDTWEKVDTRTYGCIHYVSEEGVAYWKNMV